MTDLTFANPAWFWGLLVLLPLLGLRVWSHLAAHRQLPGLVSPRLFSFLVSGSGQAQRWVTFCLQALAIAATLAALARPQMGFEEVDTQEEARNLLVAIDTSRSMLANDLTPNRLSRAKLAAMDIVRSLPKDRIGLIAFAGRPFLQAPLTVDHEAILESIDQLDTEIIPRGGTNLSASVELALKTFEESETEQSALVIFSDGEALEGLEQVDTVREQAKAAGMSILTVGVGTSSGAIIPEMDEKGDIIPGVFVKDDQGQVVRSRLDPIALQSLAKDGGIYLHLGGRASLTQVVQELQKGIATSREESEAALRPVERFMWPLSFAIFAFVLSHAVPLFWLKPANAPGGLPTFGAARILAGFLVMTASLSSADDAFFTGHEQFTRSDYDAAIESYEGALSERTTPTDTARLHMGIGASAFRKGDFERAANAFGEALVDSPQPIREHAHYNLGNTLYRQGESALTSIQQPANPDQLQTLAAPSEVVDSTIQRWESAIEHYESALALNEENEKASHNIEIVKKRIEELKKQQEEEKQEQQDEEEKEEEKEDDEEQKEEEEEQQEENEENSDKNEEESPDDQQDQQDQPKEDGESEPNENDSENNDNPEDQQDPENQENEDPGDEPNEPENGENEEGESDQNQDGQPQPEQPQSDAPEEGELEANPNQEQPGSPQQPNPAQAQRNPETGYSPSEARQLLEALADETEVRPILRPSRGEQFKNW